MASLRMAAASSSSIRSVGDTLLANKSGTSQADTGSSADAGSSLVAGSPSSSVSGSGVAAEKMAMAKLLLQAHDIDLLWEVMMADGNGCGAQQGLSPLHAAAQASYHGADKVLGALLQLLAKAKVKAEALAVCDHHGLTPLHHTALAGTSASVRTLVAAGADVNALSDSNPPLSPLHVAARAGNVSALDALIAAGAASPPREGMTWLAAHEAVLVGSSAALALLLTSYPTPSVNATSPLLIHLAASSPASLASLELLLATGANPNVIDSRSSFTPLHTAVASCNMPALHALASCPAVNVLVQSTLAGTALHTAAAIDSREGLFALLEHVPTPEARAAALAETHPSTNHSVLATAVTAGALDVVTALVTVEPMICDPPNESHLFLAAANGHVRILSLLFDIIGRDATKALDSDGFSLIHHAAARSMVSDELIEILGGPHGLVTMVEASGLYTDLSPLDLAVLGAGEAHTRGADVVASARVLITAVPRFVTTSSLHLALDLLGSESLLGGTFQLFNLLVPSRADMLPLFSSAAALGKDEWIATLDTLYEAREPPRTDTRKATALSNALLEAINANHLTTTCLLLGMGATAPTAVHRAAAVGATQILIELLSAGPHAADSARPDTDGLLPIHYAAAAGNIEACKVLAKAEPECLNALDENPGSRRSPLQHALATGPPAVALALIRLGADPELHDGLGHTALHHAAHSGHADAVHYMLAKHPHIANVSSPSEHTALHAAAAATKSSRAIIHALVSSGLAPDTTDATGATPLHIAVAAGNAAAVAGLVAVGADATKLDGSGISARERADQLAASGHPAGARIVSILTGDAGGAEAETAEQAAVRVQAAWRGFRARQLYCGAPSRAVSLGLATSIGLVAVRTQLGDSKPINVYDAAASRNNIGVLREQLEDRMASLDETDELGRTVLVRAILRVGAPFASRADAVELVRTLVDAGAPVTAADELGHSPLHYAAALNAVDVVELLLSGLVDVGALDAGGNSPLHYANVEVAEVLLAHGASAMAPNATSYTPIHAASAADNLALLEVLLDTAGVTFPLTPSALDLALLSRARRTSELLMHRSSLTPISLHAAALGGDGIIVSRVIGAQRMTSGYRGKMPMSCPPQFSPLLARAGGASLPTLPCDLLSARSPSPAVSISRSARSPVPSGSACGDVSINDDEIGPNGMQKWSPLAYAVWGGRVGAALALLKEYGSHDCGRPSTAGGTSELGETLGDDSVSAVDGGGGGAGGGDESVTGLGRSGQTNCLAPRGMSSLLHVAARSSNCSVALIELLLTWMEATLASRDSNGWTPLHVAVAAELSTRPTSVLLRLGADVTALTERAEHTVLHTAARHARLAVVEEVVTAPGASLAMEIKDGAGLSPRDMALVCGREDVVEVFVRRFGWGSSRGNGLHAVARLDAVDMVPFVMRRYRPDVNGRDGRGFAPLHYAAVQATSSELPLTIISPESPVLPQQGRVVTALLEHGADVEVRNGRGATPLHLAAKYGRIGPVEILLKAKASVLATNVDGATPLHLAAKYDHPEVVSRLLASPSADAAVVAGDASGRAPQHHAAQLSRADVARLLLDAGGHPLQRDDQERTPLHEAAAAPSQSTRVLRVYLDALGAGASLEVLDASGRTPIHYAAAAGSTEALSMMMQAENRPNPDGRDRNGQTPLALAAAAGHLEVVRILVSRLGVDVSGVDDAGNTPLHAAVRAGALAVVELLLAQEQVAVNATNNSGETALHVAGAGCDEDDALRVAYALLSCGREPASARVQVAGTGETPAESARTRGMHELAHLIEVVAGIHRERTVRNGPRIMRGSRGVLPIPIVAPEEVVAGVKVYPYEAKPFMAAPAAGPASPDESDAAGKVAGLDARKAKQQRRRRVRARVRNPGAKRPRRGMRLVIVEEEAGGQGDREQRMHEPTPPMSGRAKQVLSEAEIRAATSARLARFHRTDAVLDGRTDVELDGWEAVDPLAADNVFGLPPLPASEANTASHGETASSSQAGSMDALPELAAGSESSLRASGSARGLGLLAASVLARKVV
ncbi:ankyrin [Thecamonas trahens ATCC 50062]|uniref:Ankyrin n=1 Tax=Thecamonas trahens ATCC 50062 TaxID=461836 RepID=A0A0L0DH74_THETB|nr:ankyrin [Thecamonas trahens ATCC 50062]KNC51486.1 ankyrin [Thecamonas trahens ATCC 50062]|eukprot:XP_013756145.1 ankyrin [Thecamonas trahens ATCC 50062]